MVGEQHDQIRGQNDDDDHPNRMKQRDDLQISPFALSQRNHFRQATGNTAQRGGGQIDFLPLVQHPGTDQAKNQGNDGDQQHFGEVIEHRLPNTGRNAQSQGNADNRQADPPEPVRHPQPIQSQDHAGKQENQRSQHPGEGRVHGPEQRPSQQRNQTSDDELYVA